MEELRRLYKATVSIKEGTDVVEAMVKRPTFIVSTDSWSQPTSCIGCKRIGECQVFRQWH